ncbi:MAG: GAF domain-containing protein [Alphaproteobacteria bacterium]|jgi:hypothetical protein|nr:GAF domain-containing protein [Alphaproteobacteria bacterium]
MISNHLDALVGHARALLHADGTWRRRVQIGLVLVGTSVVAVAQLLPYTLPAPWHGVITVVGIAGAAAALLGGVVLNVIDRNTADVLAAAFASERRGDELEREADREADRAWFNASLYSIARTGIELVEAAPRAETIERDVAEGLAYELSELIVYQKGDLLGIGDEEWSVSIFIYEPRADELVPVVSRRRSVSQERAEHRRWPRDAGHCGRAFTTRNVLVCPDATDPSESQYFLAPMGLRRQSDAELYRSFASVPILRGSGDAIGVVVATSDRVGRFQRVETESGELDRIEPLRLLAGMVALLYAYVDDEEQ